MDRARIIRVLDTIHGGRAGPITHLVHGAARGADTLAGRWVWMHPVDNDDPADLGRHKIVEVQFPVTNEEWRTIGKRAGILRNEKMLAEGKPDLVVAFPGGRGTAHMVGIARTADIPVIEVAL